MTEQQQCIAELVKLFGVEIPAQICDDEVTAQLASLFAQGELVTTVSERERQRLAAERSFRHQ